MRCKDLESLKEHISQHESHLGQDPLEDNTPDDDGLFSHGAEVDMAAAPGADDIPSESAMTQLKAKPMPRRWTKRVLSHLQLVLSPMRMTNCYWALAQSGSRPT